MKRTNDADNCQFHNFFDDEDLQYIIRERNMRIQKIRKEYDQLVKEIETYYQDQSHLLCDDLINHTRKQIELVIQITNSKINAYKKIAQNKSGFTFKQKKGSTLNIGFSYCRQ